MRHRRAEGAAQSTGSTAIDLASVTHPDDLDNQTVVEDLVHDPVRPDADPVHAWLADHCDAVGGPGLVSQEVDRGMDSLLVPSLQRCQGSLGTARDLDAVPRGHASPSSALTSSHGT